MLCMICKKRIHPNQMRIYRFSESTPSGIACKDCGKDFSVNYDGKTEIVKMGFVYIIKGELKKDNKTVYYIGSTKRPLNERFFEHQNATGKAYTARMKNKHVVLYFYMAANSVIRIEMMLKKNRHIAYAFLEKEVTQWDLLQRYNNTHIHIPTTNWNISENLVIDALLSGNYVEYEGHFRSFEDKVSVANYFIELHFSLDKIHHKVDRQ